MGDEAGKAARETAKEYGDHASRAGREMGEAIKTLRTGPQKAEKPKDKPKDGGGTTIIINNG